MNARVNTRVNISLEHAAVRIGATDALSNFSGEFTPGTVSALIGGDGAGKSTLLRALAGQLPLHATRSDGLPVDPRRVGFQPADAGVWRNLSVAENVEFVSRSYGATGAEAELRARELLERAGLSEATDRLAGQLSGGMRQKLGVVLATLHRPSLVLLDEPTTGVDPISRAELWSLIAATAAEGATVVFATTYLDEAERASRLFLLSGGTLLAAGTPDAVIAQAPGRIWQAPAARKSARFALNSRQAWRRGDTVYVWDASPDAAAPPGFRAAPKDLENSCISLLAVDSPETLAATGTGSPPAELPSRGSRHAPDELLLEGAEVRRSYGAFNALSGVSIHVSPGEVVGLLGGNGAGKTTLMRILLGLETPSAGSAQLFGTRPELETRRRIGYVAQGLGLYSALSAVENLEFAAAVHGAPVVAASRHFAERFGRGPISALPLGAQRILAYLAAAGHGPELLVLDEPTSGMDALARARLWRELRAQADSGTGILVTTHYMQEAAQCDRLVILTSGSVTAAGTTEEITGNHSSLTVESASWERAFTLLREAGLPALLDGRTLRLPGSSRGAVAAALEGLDEAVVIASAHATLDEAMLLDATAARLAARGGQGGAGHA